MLETKDKIVSVAALRRRMTRLRAEGKKVAFTNGCFDILHYGHVSYLEAARKHADVLIIGMNSDSSVRGLKGKDRPVVPQEERARVLAALAAVDYVTIFNEPTPERLIRSICPDVLLKGADWRGKEVAGGAFLKANGGRVEFVRFVPGISTTNIIEKIQRLCKKK